MSSLPCIRIVGSAAHDVKTELMKALENAGFTTHPEMSCHESKQADGDGDVFTVCVDSADENMCPRSIFHHYQYRYLWGELSSVQEFIHCLQDFLRTVSGKDISNIINGAETDSPGAHDAPRGRFVSTRGHSDNATFTTVVLEGLAKDGGLYIPTHLLTMPPSQLDYFFRTRGLRYTEAAQIILEQLVDNSISPAVLHSLIMQAYDPCRWSGKEDICPVTPLLGDKMGIEAACADTPTMDWKHDISVMELYHGPTAAFKDFALQLFPLCFNAAADGKCKDGHTDSTAEIQKVEEEGSTRKERPSYLVLTATSGDTGVAAISGFSNAGGRSKVMILYPLYGVSPVQQLQMLSYDNGIRVRVFGIDSNYDFCQKSAKAVFMDSDLISKLAALKPPLRLSSANSINWGRFIPQVVYYCWAYRHYVQSSSELITSGRAWSYGDPIDIAVPCGNFGNILSGYYAKLMGIPIRKLIVASNKNDVLFEFIETGCYDLRKRRLEPTASPSIDILKASNVERLLYLLSDGDTCLVEEKMAQLDTQNYFEINAEMRRRMTESFVAYRCDEEDCAAMIKEVFDASGGRRLLDSHTAVAMHAAKVFREGQLRGCNLDSRQGIPPLVVLGTAHWAKFPEAVLHAIRGEEMVHTPPSSHPEETMRHVWDLYKRIHEMHPAGAVSGAGNLTQEVQPALAKALQPSGFSTNKPRSLPVDVEAVKEEVIQFSAV
ncbi:unnamed protein product [Phytomonas sp. EM1]|nr:unnamed protein product [Phytomonas sp. EM1]|eukprot:CCW61268.1 unnamed protein product [Phytomonas sp. isolate EM1]